MQNPTYEERKAALIEEIHTVFDGVSRDNGVSLSESQVVDDYGSMEERAEARKKDTETRWQDVPDEQISHGYSCLSFLDEIGFRYYIPAYMVWYLRYVDNEEFELAESNTFESLIYSLKPVFSQSLHEHQMSRFRQFTTSESKTIAHFLQFTDEIIDEWHRSMDEEDIETMRKEGKSLEEIETQKLEDEKFRIERSLKDSYAKHAVREYWGQFL